MVWSKKDQIVFTNSFLVLIHIFLHIVENAIDLLQNHIVGFPTRRLKSLLLCIWFNGEFV